MSLNGDQRRTTQNNIKKVIGSYDDFILTSMSSQNDTTVFIDKTQINEVSNQPYNKSSHLNPK